MQFVKSDGIGGNNFIKLKDGESVKGVFRGDLHHFHQHWEGNKALRCLGKETCPSCKEGKKALFRFRLNLVVNENGAYTAKIFEQGWTVHEALRALHEGDYNLEQHLMKITRYGTGTDTSYAIIPVPNGSLTEDKIKAIAAVPLHSLDGSQKEEQEVSENVPF